MNKNILWIHEKALSHSVINTEQSDLSKIFIWDNKYFIDRCYSLKRLVFIYETLCEMRIKIIKGNTIEVLRSLAPDKITTFSTNDIKIKDLINQVSNQFYTKTLDPNPFVSIPKTYEFKRFFKYWNKAKKTAFMINGGNNA